MNNYHLITLLMKYWMLVLLTLLLTSCTQAANPDEDFDKMYDSPMSEINEGISNEIENNDEKIEEEIDFSDSDNKLLINTTNMDSVNQTALPEKWEEIVEMETTKWIIKIRLFPTQAPKTVENFKGLISKKYYDWIIFHRIIKDFMIQWGDPTWTWSWGESLWGWKFEDEFDDDLKNINWALSMANAGPGTNGSQFFIVTAPSTPWLDWAHTVFGQVFEWMEIVKEIEAVETWVMDKPEKEIKMISVKLVNN